MESLIEWLKPHSTLWIFTCVDQNLHGTLIDEVVTSKTLIVVSAVLLKRTTMLLTQVSFIHFKD